MDEFFIVSISNSLLYETLLYKEGKKTSEKFFFIISIRFLILFLLTL